MFDNGYYKASQEYERYLSEYPMSKEERLTEYETKQDYLDAEGDRMFDEARISGG